MASVSAIILTRNEEKNLGDCLASLRGFAERCVVVDCGSSDRTVEIAREMGADVYMHEFTYYAAQFNWAIDNADIRTDWILRIDADERLTPALIEESERIIASPAAREGELNGVVMEADYVFLGRTIKYGLHKKRRVMLFKRGIGRIEDRRRDAHSVISRGVTATCKNRFIHKDFKDLDSYIRRYNWYATREMQDWLDFKNGASQQINAGAEIARNRRNKFGVYYRAPRFFRAWLWFLYNYIFRLGFLDGREGFLYLYFECYWYRMLVDAKIFEHEVMHTPLEELKALD